MKFGLNFEGEGVRVKVEFGERWCVMRRAIDGFSAMFRIIRFFVLCILAFVCF